MNEEETINEQTQGDQDFMENNADTGSLINNDQPSTDMEVHKHPHHVTHKKQWGEYLLEFVMLFLAVYLGFVAENYRETLSERHHEKQYMESMLTDLREDTTEIKKSITSAMKTMAYEDSVIYYLYKSPPVDTLPASFLDFDGHALLRLNVVFNEATAQQLKNSGNMRLIENTSLARKISIYWNQQQNAKISLDRYLIYRNRGREAAENLYAFSEFDLVDAGLIKSLPHGKVIQSNHVLWAEYSNIISHCHVTAKGYSMALKQLLIAAEELIDLIQKKYNLE